MTKLKKIQIVIVILTLFAVINLYMSLQEDFGFVQYEEIDWVKILNNKDNSNNNNNNNKEKEKGNLQQQQIAYEIVQQTDPIKQSGNKQNKLSDLQHKQSTIKQLSNLESTQAPQNIIVERIQQINRSKLTQKERDQLTKQRIQMGQPRFQNRKIGAWIISGKHRSRTCAIFNTLNIITQVSVATGKLVLDSSSFGHSIYLVDSKDELAHSIIKQRFVSTSAKYISIKLDAQYKFMRVLMGAFGCQKIVYMNHNFKLLPSQQYILQSALQKCRIMQVCYTTKVSQNSQVTQKNLPVLPSANLQLITVSVYNSYIFIFESQYFGLISPLNFAYYAKYTIEQIIILPILALSQKLNKLVPINDIIHQITSPYVQSAKYYKLQQVKTQQGVNQFCFVSYPSNPSQISYDDLRKYLKSIESLNRTKASISLFVYLPYWYEQRQSKQFMKIVHQIGLMKQAHIHIQIVHRVNKTVSSASVYESAHLFCHNGAIIVASRHNTEYHPQFLQQIINKIQVNPNSHYFFTSFKNQQGKRIKLTKSQLQSMKKQKQKAVQLYKSHLYAVQVFKTNLMKACNLFWQLRPVNFHQSEVSFVLPLLQCATFDVQIIEQQMITLSNNNRRDNEQQQIQNITKLHKPLTSIKTLQPQIYYQIGLYNQGYKRNRQSNIPRILHIFSQSNDKGQYLLKYGPGFKIIVWKQINISAENFPLTYTFISRRMLQKQELNQCIFIKRILAYEIVYQYGGVYLQQFHYKTKNIENMLNFDIFFNSFTPCSKQIQKNEVCVKFDQSIFGANQHNYHLKLFLTEVLTQSLASDQTLTHSDQQKYRIEQVFNNKQLSTSIGFGSHFLTTQQQDSIIKQSLSLEACFGP